jgi:hypothetical protein
MQLVIEDLMILCVYLVEFGALLLISGLLWWLFDLGLAQTARKQRRVERRARNRNIAA